MLPVTSRLGTDAVLGLANSQHGPGAHYRRRARVGDAAHDHLDTPLDAIEFLGTHHIPIPDPPPTGGQLARLRELRALARSLIDDPALDLDAWRAAVDGALTGIDYRLRPDGTLRSAAAGWDGVADDLLPALLVLAGERDRLKHCGNPLCTWLFIDRSPRRSRVWCEAAVCGNRVRVGRHRRRGSTSPAGRPASRRDTPSGPRG